jgi:hypothetical protein
MTRELLNVQHVIFHGGVDLKKKAQTIVDLNAATSDLFSGDPIILPIPNDAPPEIPRMELSSADRQWILRVAKQRVDLFFTPRKDDPQVELPADTFTLCAAVFGFFIERLQAQVSRASLVETWAVPVDEGTAAEFLERTYIRPDSPIPRVDDLELHYLERDTIGGFEANLWTRISVTRKIVDDRSLEGVKFLLDANTIAERDYVFDREMLSAYLAAAHDRMAAVLESNLER